VFVLTLALSFFVVDAVTERVISLSAWSKKARANKVSGRSRGAEDALALALPGG